MQNNSGNSQAQLNSRYWPTVKAARLVGLDVPEEASDEETIVFVEKSNG